MGGFLGFGYLILSIIFGINTHIHAQVCPDNSADISDVNADCANRIANGGGQSTCPYQYGYQALRVGVVALDGGLHYACYAPRCFGSGYSLGLHRYLRPCNAPLAPKPEVLFEKSCSVSGSIINVESESLGESIPLVGANFKLNYFTKYAHRIVDYRYAFPPNPANPSNITSMVVTATTNLPSSSTVTYSSRPVGDIVYDWDGKDLSGSFMWGSLTYSVTINEYRGGHLMPTSNERAVGNFQAIKLGIGGWLPSNYNFYDKNSSTLYRGDGGIRKISVNLNSNNQYIIPELDGSFVYVFDSIGRQVEIKLGITGSVIYTFNYNGFGQLESISEPHSRVTTFNRDGNGKLISITTPYNKTSPVVIDASGFLISISNPASEIYSMTYNSRGILLTFMKPNSALSTFTYDALDRLVKDEHSSGSSTSILTVGENWSSKQQSMTSKMGRVHNLYTSYTPTLNDYNWQNIGPDGASDLLLSYANDTIGNATMIKRNNVIVSNKYTKKNSRFDNLVEYPLLDEIKFGPVNRVVNYTDSISYVNPGDPFSINTWTKTKTIGTSVFNSVYTGSNKTSVSTTPLGRISTQVWDSLQRPLSIQQGSLTPTVFSYSNENLISITQGSRVTSFNYSSVTGLLNSIINPLNQTTSFVYDSGDRVTSVVFPDLRVVNYTYNSNGDIQSVTPAGRPAHVYNYGINELLSSYVPPLISGIPNVSTTYTYNSDNQLLQIVRPDGQTITNTYNGSSGKLTTITTPQRVINFTHGGSSTGTPSMAMSYGSGKSLSFSYWVDELNSIRTDYGDSKYSIYSWSRNTTGYAYIKSDTFNIYGVNSVVGYGYDADEMLTSAGSLTLAYNTPDGQLSTTALGTITDSRTYNSFGEVVGYQGKINGVGSYSYALTRDELGRVVTKAQTIPGRGTDSYWFTYDISGRLSQVSKNGVVDANYIYDDNNNRIAGNVAGIATSAIYDNQDRLTNYNMYNYEYNANGDLEKKIHVTTGNITRYTYDAFGNLTKVILPDATVIEYDIDGLNRRIGRSVNGVLQVRYLYMDQYRIGAEMNPNGTIKRRYVYASKVNIPDYYIEAGSNYKIFSDHLGSLRMIVNETSGAVVCTQDNDEFGRVTLATSPGCSIFGFAGGLYDADTGLVRFGVRDYDPETGRWTSKDPILFDGRDTNLYGYVQSDPVNWVDPTGEVLVAPIAIGAGVGAAVDIGMQLIDSGGDYKNINWTSVVTSAAVGGALGGAGRILGPFSPKGLPKGLGRIRQFLRFDPPHHGKWWHLDGIIGKELPKFLPPLFLSGDRGSSGDANSCNK